jgi:acetyl-CoA C-acetyltransferase
MAVPVIVGVGQATHRDDTDPAPAEPVELIVDAARAAADDARGAVLGAVLDAVDSLELMGVGSWYYDDLPALVAGRLGLDVPASRRTMHPTGGETPLRALDVAATRIAAGDARVCLLAGAEGTRAAVQARQERETLPWTRAETPARPPRFTGELADSFALGIERAFDCFPMYEHALRAHEGRSFADAQQESARLWASLSRVATANPYAWTRAEVTEDALATPGPDNRMVAYPYTKLLMANPFVNQGAAVLVTSTETARALGVPEDSWVYPWGGAGADEPPDPRTRAEYFRSPALEAAVRGVQALTGTAADDYDAVELYSCFPAMPKLTARALGALRPEAVSVTGGLSFFGGPGSNYMTHALAAMVERLRDDGGTGFLHGVGMYNTKHHALVLSTRPPARRDYPPAAHAVGEVRPPRYPPVPVADGYEGRVTIETCSVRVGRGGVPERAVVLGRGVGGERIAARVPDADADSLGALTDGTEPVGRVGTVVASRPPTFRL